jgi:hypothetical protein
VELAAPPGSDWCGDKKRSQGAPSEPLRKGGPKCRNMVWKPESGEPAATRAEPGEGLGQGQEVVYLPEAEEPALESVAEFLGHAIDISMQEIEERSVYYREEELPVLELEEPPNEWERESNHGD